MDLKNLDKETLEDFLLKSLEEMKNSNNLSIVRGGLLFSKNLTLKFGLNQEKIAIKFLKICQMYHYYDFVHEMVIESIKDFDISVLDVVKNFVETTDFKVGNGPEKLWKELLNK